MLQRSVFASLSPSTIVTRGTVYVALKCYFDGSLKHHRRLTLAAVAGDEIAWLGLEQDWRAFLDHVHVPYSHMKEAIARKEAFQGWPKDKRDWFVDGLITFFDDHRSKNPGRLKAFTSTVDLKAHEEFAQTIPGLPEAPRMCMRSILPKIFEWYFAFPDKFLDVIELYFDRNEPFMQHIWDDWNSERVRTEFPVWGLIRTIAPVEMKVTPGVQVADLFAWSRTHFDTRGARGRFFGAAGLLCHPSSADHFLFDRDKIKTYPPFTIM